MSLELIFSERMANGAMRIFNEWAVKEVNAALEEVCRPCEAADPFSFCTDCQAKKLHVLIIRALKSGNESFRESFRKNLPEQQEPSK